jgi:hypothetical protein
MEIAYNTTSVEKWTGTNMPKLTPVAANTSRLQEPKQNR